MAKKRIVALAYSDHHIGTFKQFDNKGSRLINSLDVWRVLSFISKKHHRVPILFAGDLFELPKQLPNEVFVKSMEYYEEYIESQGIDLVAIDGNHDQAESNTITHRSPNFLQGFNKAFDTFHHLEYGYKDFSRFRVFGIPYLKRNEGFVKILKKLKKKLDPERKNILLIHTDLPSVEYPNGLVPEEVPGMPRRLNKLFEGFDLILCGHIHKKKKVSKNIYMLGAPQQQSIEESGLRMGYWEIYSDMTIKFKYLDMYPEFKFIMEGEKLPDTFNYYTVIPKPKEEVKDKGKQVKKRFTNIISNKKLVRNYLKEIGVKNKAKSRLLTKILDDAAKD